MDPTEPHWRTNSSFSPPPSRRWDCRYQSDGLSRGSHGAPLFGSSLSSNSKGSRSRVSSEQYPNHQHTVSDGVLSYFGSPSDNFQDPHWTPPVQNFNFTEFATPVGGSRPDTPLFAQSTEVTSNNFESPSPLSESALWESSSKQPVSLPQRNFSGRRSFMSKPVYPLVFQNPVSDSEVFGLSDTASDSRLTPCENRTSPVWANSSTSNLELKFHKTLTEFEKMEASPDPRASSRREGFRWSNASSYDMGLDRESIDMSENIDLENFRPFDQKCGLCGRLLCQKSPWSSYRIVRSSDMPIAGILPCSHVFHADCLEQTTPKTQIHDPPCPTCLKTASWTDSSSSISEPLELALRSVRRNQGVSIAVDGVGTSSNQSSDQIEGVLSRNRSLPVPRRGGYSLLKNHFKKHFSFKGKAGKDLLGAKMFCRSGSSSELPVNQNAVGCSRTGQSSKK
ncbi:uncharacterized protein LOC143863906 [Tasmannia lanceolata]|uniref:uncharacterized protein LOC143863906 n=1 Tax=Tasmannia lanceolata TaxID=3420 RepID=UPI004062DE0B